jgi:pyrophosphatase PpaX
MIRKYCGIEEMLSGLKKLGIGTAIVSSKGRNGIERGLNAFKLRSYIDIIVSAYDVSNHKPHPEPALKALELLGGNPGEALFAGDSPYDIECGKNAGVKTVLVGWSVFPKDTLLLLSPDYIIKTPAGLVDIFRTERRL